ncbi:MAG TPA: hypothetical protein DCL21_03160 [Alphaproteobacteria bacterium]|nr:hypothetical protein [Alphaproteobacteria bacterium]
MILDFIKAIENDNPEKLDTYPRHYLESNKQELFDYALEYDSTKCFIYLTSYFNMASIEPLITKDDLNFYIKHKDYIIDDFSDVNIESWMNDTYHALLKNATNFAGYYLDRSTTLEEVMGFIDFDKLNPNDEAYLNICDLVIQKNMTEFGHKLSTKLSEIILATKNSREELKSKKEKQLGLTLLLTAEEWLVKLNDFIDYNYAKAS